ncbi:MAG: MMPL family transporter, partial [Planctomycetota bacterium]
MSNLFNRTTDWIVRIPALTLLLIGIITAFSVVGYYDHRLIKDLLSPPEESETSASVEDPSGTPPVSGFSFDAEAIIVIESDQIFTPGGARALRAIDARLEDSDLVRNVVWLDEIPMLNIFSMPQPVLPNANASPKRFELAREKALRHPFIRGQLLSEDSKTALMLVTFDRFFVKQDSDVTAKIREMAESVAEQHSDFDAKFTVTGRLPIWIEARRSQDANNFTYQLIGYSMIALMSIVLFRGFAAVFVVALAPCLGVFWTLGFVQYLDYSGNPFNDVVLPVLVSLIALTDGVHLMVEIRKLRSQGMQPRAAAREGIRKVGLACALTSLTTAIGFGSLGLANHELVQQFGFSCVLGVLLSFVAVVTAIPLACSSWIGKFVHVGLDKSLVDKNLGKISLIIDFVMNRKTSVALVAIFATILFVIVSLGLRPDERRSTIIPVSSEAAVGLRKIDEAMQGVERSFVDLKWSAQIEKDSPEIARVIQKVDQVLDAEE